MEDTDILARLKQKVATYKPSDATVALVKGTPKLFLVGITAAGKDTIMRQLMKSGKYHLVVSHTTRQPRANNGVMEQNGVEYHFITLDQAEQMLDSGAYVEANMFGTNIYGTSAAEIGVAHNTHKIAATDIEVHGVARYMNIDPHTKAVFILPPSYEVWQERLLGRHDGKLDQTETDQRLQIATQELSHVLETPYFHFVVNDSLAEAVAEIDKIAAGTETPAEAAHARKVAETILQRLKLSRTS